MTTDNFDLFTGTANPELASEVSKILGIPLSAADVGYFSDGEIKVQIEDNVRGHDTFIIQSTCTPQNKNLMELMLLADALKRSSASRITAVVPYYGYARQDRRVRSARVPISAKVVADMFSSVGIDRVLTIDLHSETIQGFFDMPADNVYAAKLMVDDIKENNERKDIVLVSPDVGGVVRTRAIAKLLDDSDLAIIDKRRAAANQSEVMNIIGDIEGKVCIVPDDIIDTAGTLCNAAKALINSGAKEVFAHVTHGVLSGEAIKRVNDSALTKLVITDTINETDDIKNSNKIETVSVVHLLGEAIRRISEERSVSSLFD